jgi:hypothetical protein
MLTAVRKRVLGTRQFTTPGYLYLVSAIAAGMSADACSRPGHSDLILCTGLILFIASFHLDLTFWH